MKTPAILALLILAGLAAAPAFAEPVRSTIAQAEPDAVRGR